MEDLSFEIIQLEEADVKRLTDFIKENPDKTWISCLKSQNYLDGITIALQCLDAKVCCINKDYNTIYDGSVKVGTTVENTYVLLLPDKILCGNSFSTIGQGKREVSKSTGDEKYDNVIASCMYYPPIYEEDSFAALIEKQSDGSEDYYPYGEKFEELRSAIIIYEQEMRKKYLSDFLTDL